MKKRTLTKLFSMLFVIVMLAMVMSVSFGCVGQHGTSNDESLTSEKSETEAPQTEESETAAPTPEELNEEKYREAIELIERGEYEASYKLFKELGDFADSEKYLSRFHYVEIKAEGRYEYEDESENYSFTTYHILNDKNLVYRIVRSSDDGHDYDEFTYDDHGNLIRDESVYDDGDKAIFEYLYDANNNQIKEICRFSSGSVMIYDYVLDEQGRTIKEIRNYSSGDSAVLLYTYDEDGNMIKTVREDSDNTGYTVDCTYDERGNLLEKITTYSNGVTEGRKCTYDANNNLLTDTFSDNWGDAVYEYKYENGRLIEETYIDDNNNTSITNYTYDEKGNLIKEVSVDDGKYTTIYEYTYDDAGNIIDEIYTSAWGYKRISKSTYKLVYVPYDLSGSALYKNQ